MTMTFTIIDAAIILIYLLGMLVLGFIMGKSNKTQEDYFVAKRSLPWLPIGLSIAATMISCNSFVGGPGWGYNSGLLPFMQNITVPLALFISTTVFVPMLYDLKLTSVYEYIELRLGPKTRMVAVLGFILNSLIQVSSMVFVPSLVLQRFMGVSINTIIPVIVVIAVVYTMAGGIKAVIWTDAIQLVVIWGGLIGGMIFLFAKSDIGFLDTVRMAGAAGKLKALDTSWQFSLTNENGFWAALVGGLFMWSRYFSFDQAQVQRMFTAKSIRELKRSFVVSGIMMNVLYFLFIFLGTLLFIQFGGTAFENANDVMIRFIGGLPVGLVGLLLASLFAAAMSSVDSLLNSMSTVFTKDIYERYIKKGKEASLKTSMLVSALWGILIYIITMLAFSGTSKSILAVIGSYISYISGPTCGIFLLAMLTKKANDKGTVWGAVIGFIMTLLFGRLAGFTWMWNSAFGTVITFLSGYVFSCLLGEPVTGQTERYTVQGHRAFLRGEGRTEENGISLLPFTVDRYSMILFVFFLLQLVGVLLLERL
jgi:SSS family solute:Na+ symporter